MTFRRVALILVLVVGFTPPAEAYDPATTHAGMTERAALHKNLLHSYLSSVHGLPLGIFEPVRLDPMRVPYLLREDLRQHLKDLDPAHGYRPDHNHNNRALSWLAAGSVLEEMPFTRGRNHFFNPRNGRGLRNSTGRWGLSLRMRVLDFMDGHGNFGGIWTGSNFNLNGKSALRWATHRFNELNLSQHHKHRLAALISPTQAARRHHLAMALLTAGALLHLLQDMAVPAHVRNDFVGTYLVRRSNIRLDRASAYETYVRKQWGRSGIPKVSGTIPSYSRLRDFFRNRAGTGLADYTQRSFFSLGSLPTGFRIARGDSPTDVLETLRKSIRIPSPHIPRLHLGLAKRGGVYFGSAENPYIFAYRINRGGTLELTLDKSCYKASATRLIPRATRYSAGFLRFLLRGRLEILRRGKQLVVTHSGPDLAAGKLTVLWEDSKGRRTPLQQVDTKAGLKPGAVLLTLPPGSKPQAAQWLVFAWSGKDAAGEQLTMGGRWRKP
ncbi:MAG: hypothetical protein ABI333_20670 [bacterium]